MTKSKPADPNLKMTLIERMGLSFEALIGREFGKRFYAPEFLHELIDKKAAVDAEMSKSMSLTFLLASIMTFFDLISGKISLGSGLSIELSKDISPILGFLTASSLMRTAFLAIDVQIINQVLIRLGSNIGVSNFSLIFINRKSINLWSDALIPTYFGAQSGKTHHVIFVTFGILIGTLALVTIAYPSAAIIISAIDILNSDIRILGKLISSASVFILVIIYFMMICFFSRYQFLPADFDESTREPTEHLKRAMEERFARENSGPVPPASGPESHPPQNG